MRLLKKRIQRRVFRLYAALRETVPPGLASAARTAAPADLFRIPFLRRERRARNEAIFRSLCSPVYVGDETALCRVLGTYKMYVDTTDMGLSTHLMLDGYWEMWVTEVMQGLLRPGMTAVDVGANLGHFTLLMAGLVGEGGKVHAIEPNPAIAARLRRNAVMNGLGGRIAVHGDPLSDEDGQDVVLVVPEGDPKNAHVLPAAEAAGLPGEGCAHHPARTRRLDALLGDAPVDFVKIDAEGFEEAIWRGMRGILDRRAPLTVFLEFRTSRYADAAGFLAELLREGFALARIDLEHGVLPATADEVLELGRTDDVMLALTR